MAYDFTNVNKEIKKVLDLLPVIYQLLDDSAIVTVLDREGTVLGYQIPERERPLKQIGEHMDDPSGGFDEVLRTGKRKYNFLPKEVMGVAFEGYIVPVKDVDEVVGVIIYTHPARAKDEVIETANKFEASIDKIDSSIVEMTEKFELLGTALGDMVSQAENVRNDIGEANAIVEEISSNAANSRILALNASIEAARTGEVGRGFAVVAKEMGNLAQSSGVSSKEITVSLENIGKDIDSISAYIDTSGELSKENKESIEAIKKELQVAIDLARKLKNTWQ